METRPCFWYVVNLSSAFSFQGMGVLIISFFTGSTLGSFMLLYCVLTLFGTFLITRDIDDNGCDPSGGVKGNATCGHSGADVFGAMLGVAFATQGVSQVGNFFETFTVARVAAYPALQAIRRQPGAPEETIYKPDDDDEAATAAAATTTTTDDVAETKSKATTDEDVEAGNNTKRIKAILPKYTIDSSSEEGVKPEKVIGTLTFKNVQFSYPTRPNKVVLNDFSLEIPAGKTVALVGPRYDECYHYRCCSFHFTFSNSFCSFCIDN